MEETHLRKIEGKRSLGVAYGHLCCADRGLPEGTLQSPASAREWKAFVMNHQWRENE